MSEKIKKQFGIWLDSQHATIIGNGFNGFEVLGTASKESTGGNSSEKAEHNLSKTLQHKFYKEITAFMPNADEVLVTGTGKEQEQFIHYLAETPQYKHTKAKETTLNKTDDAQLVSYVAEHFATSLS